MRGVLHKDIGNINFLSIGVTLLQFLNIVKSNDIFVGQTIKSGLAEEVAIDLILHVRESLHDEVFIEVFRVHHEK